MSGTCLTVTLEGRRPLLAEVQALVAPPTGPHARRAVSGLDASRLAMLLAVLERRVGLKLAPHDIYAATVGGASLRTPASDLAVAIALTSAAVNTVVPERAVAFGEVGLAGELRRVPNIGQRLSEAARLGFTAAVIPTEPGGAPRPVPDVAGLTVMECPDLFSALVALRLVPQPGGRQPVELQVVG